MSFFVQFAADRIFKRSRRLKGRPQWQDEIPSEKPARDTYRIAAKYESRFSRAFLDAVRNILPEKMSPEFREAYNQQNPVGVQNAIPLFAEGTTDQNKTWSKFGERLQSAYLNVLNESGKESMKEVNREFKSKLGFSLEPLSKAEVDEERVLRGREAAREVGRGIVVPVNPYSVAWMNERSLNLVKEGITSQQKQVIQDILSENFEKGIRAEDTYKRIKDNIGLTARDFKATQNRRALLETQGFKPQVVDKYVDKYRGTLLKKRAQRIARTETISAQARGRNDAWKIAQESGALPAVERVWIAAPPSSSPYRPCETCVDLDGKTAKVGKPYDSLEGPIMEPPAHPDCRCSEGLQKAGKPTKPTKPRPAIERPKKKPLAMPPAKLRPKPKAPKMPRGVAPRAPAPPSKVPKKPTTFLPNNPSVFAQSPSTNPALPLARKTVRRARSRKVVGLTPVQQAADQNARFIRAKNMDAAIQAATPQERKSFIHWNWVHGTKHKMPIRMKAAIKQELGLKGIVYNPNNFVVSQADINLIKKDMREVYRNTQKELRAKGIKKLRVYRGVKETIKETGVMESWTTDPQKARRFGKIVLTKEIPASKVYNYRGSSNWIDGSWGNQSEVIVLE